MKWVSLLLVFLVVAGVMGISGCTSNSTNDTSITTSSGNGTSPPEGVNRTEDPNVGVYISESQNWEVSVEKKDSSFSKSEIGTYLTEITNPKYGTYTNIKNGTKTLNGYKVYYKSFTKVNGDFQEKFFFEKNGTWYLVTIDDQPGNPNKSIIDSEIKYYMNKL